MMPREIEKAANEVDLQLFRLMERARSYADGTIGWQRVRWEAVAKTLHELRYDVRGMMSEKDRAATR